MKSLIFVLLIEYVAFVYSASQQEPTRHNSVSDLIGALNVRRDAVEAKKLIEAGYDVNRTGPLGWSPLHMASRLGFVEIARMLIDRNADVNSLNDYRDTPLHLAAIWNHEEIVQLLADHGAKINAKNMWGETPLHIAVKANRKNTARLLLENGAIQIKNNLGQTPRDVAVENGHAEIIKLLDPARHQNIRTACRKYSTRQPSDFILDGKPVEPEEFPWMAALVYLNSDYNVSFKCGGTVISERFILTAAHCLTKEPPLVGVRLGSVNLKDDEAYSFYIDKVFKHTNYSSITKRNDIGLIKLAKAIIFNPEVRPACLELNTRDQRPNIKLNVTGWGATSADSNTVSNVLLKSEVTTVPLSECNATFANYNKDANTDEFRNGISESQYCAHDPNGRADSCRGDSGGPLQIFYNNSETAHVVGIVSFGVSCGTLPGIYTRVASYLDWIESHVWSDPE